MDWVSIIAGLIAIVGLLLLWRYFRAQFRWMADVRESHTRVTNRLFEQWEEMLSDLSNRAGRLNQVYAVAQEMNEWAAGHEDPEVVQAVHAFSKRLTAISEWEKDEDEQA